MERRAGSRSSSLANLLKERKQTCYDTPTFKGLLVTELLYTAFT